MSLRLFNILASFKKYINKILVEKPNIFIIVYLDNIFIYIKNPSQSQVEAICIMLNVLKRYKFYINFKKYWFYKNKFWFFGYIISTQSVYTEKKRIKAIINWFKSELVQEI